MSAGSTAFEKMEKGYFAVYNEIELSIKRDVK